MDNLILACHSSLGDISSIREKLLHLKYLRQQKPTTTDKDNLRQYRFYLRECINDLQKTLGTLVNAEQELGKAINKSESASIDAGRGEEKTSLTTSSSERSAAELVAPVSVDQPSSGTRAAVPRKKGKSLTRRRR